MFETIRTHYQRIQAHVAHLNPNAQVIAVSKTQTVAAIGAAYAAGARHFGENYVQEAVDKIEWFGAQNLLPDAQWHFIGPIQGNKTREIAQYFDWVHSVDRLKIARRLSAQHPHAKSALNVCVQVNISDEATKSGVSIDEALDLALAIVALPQLRLRGLMCIPAPMNAEANTREACAPFEVLAALHARIKSSLPTEHAVAFDTLSMGMSADFEAALHSGSTMVRIGSAIFGARV